MPIFLISGVSEITSLIEYLSPVNVTPALTHESINGKYKGKVTLGLKFVHSDGQSSKGKKKAICDAADSAISAYSLDASAGANGKDKLTKYADIKKLIQPKFETVDGEEDGLFVAYIFADFFDRSCEISFVGRLCGSVEDCMSKSAEEALRVLKAVDYVDCYCSQVMLSQGAIPKTIAKPSSDNNESGATAAVSPVTKKVAAASVVDSSANAEKPKVTNAKTKPETNPNVAVSPEGAKATPTSPPTPPNTSNYTSLLQDWCQKQKVKNLVSEIDVRPSDLPNNGGFEASLSFPHTFPASSPQAKKIDAEKDAALIAIRALYPEQAITADKSKNFLQEKMAKAKADKPVYSEAQKTDQGFVSQVKCTVILKETGDSKKASKQKCCEKAYNIVKNSF